MTTNISSWKLLLGLLSCGLVSFSMNPLANAVTAPPVANVNVVNPSVPVTVNNTESTPVPVNVITVPSQPNDILNEPYNQWNTMNPQSGFGDGYVTFDVPAGKRLIIETITVYVTLPTGQHTRAELILKDRNVHATLELQPQGALSSTEDSLAGTYPITLRVDGDPDETVTDEIAIVTFDRYPKTNSTINVGASVHGYLVPLP